MCGVHGHYMTMKMEFSQIVYDNWWNKLADFIRKHHVKFLTGDFNMSLTQVRPQLAKRGIAVDCCSWYPWRHGDKECKGSCLGMDSCAMFYIGGEVLCSMPFGFHDIGYLADVASAPDHELEIRNLSMERLGGPQSRQDNHSLDSHSGNNVPGQHWACYKSIKNEKTTNLIPLREKLSDLLAPSTTQDRLDQITAQQKRKAPDNMLPAYLRLKQKSFWIKKSGWFKIRMIH